MQCAVRARNVCFPLMFISILKGGKERIIGCMLCIRFRNFIVTEQSSKSRRVKTAQNTCFSQSKIHSIGKKNPSCTPLSHILPEKLLIFLM